MTVYMCVQLAGRVNLTVAQYYLTDRIWRKNLMYVARVQRSRSKTVTMEYLTVAQSLLTSTLLRQSERVWQSHLNASKSLMVSMEESENDT